MSGEMTDQEVVELVKSGNRTMYSVIVRRHQKNLLRLSLRFVKDLDTAEDVVQETFIKAYERLSTFEARASFKSWLFQIAVNTAKNKLRSRRDEVSDIDNVPLAVAPVAESSLVHSAVAKLIQAYIDMLPIKQKTALVLRIYEDLSFKEIAEIMECPYDTAKANYRHALMKLRDQLSEDNELREWSEEVSGFFTEMQQRVAEVES